MIVFFNTNAIFFEGTYLSFDVAERCQIFFTSFLIHSLTKPSLNLQSLIEAETSPQSIRRLDDVEI